MNELPEHDDKYGLHCLLSTLLSMELSVDEKLGIMEKEYSIVVDDRIREDVSAMCNLPQGIRDDALAEVIMTMHEKGYTSAQTEGIVKKNACIGIIKVILDILYDIINKGCINFDERV